MKKALIPIVSALLMVTLFAGCRSNVATETTNTTAATTNTTAPATTQRPTETTRHTEPTHGTTMPMPSILPETSESTGNPGTHSTTGRGRMPRY